MVEPTEFSKITETEEVYLCQILLKPDIIVDSKIKKEYFYSLNCGRLFAVISEMFQNSEPINQITINGKGLGIDREWLQGVSEATFTAANWKYYHDEIVAAWSRRTLVHLGNKLRAIDHSVAPLDAINDAEQTFLEIMGVGASKKIMTATELAIAHARLLDERFQNRDKLPGISTGIPRLDRLTQGFRDRQFYVLGARPSEGKTALALNMFGDCALNSGLPAGMISAESANEELFDRLLSADARVDGRKIVSGNMDEQERGRLLLSASRYYDSKMVFYDEPNISLSDLISTATVMRRRHGIRILFVDYMQIVTVPSAENRQAEVATVSKALKGLARRLEIPVVALAQLNRDVDGRRPSLADFQWASQIEQDADTAMLLYHIMKNNSEGVRHVVQSYILAEKVRAGPTGAVAVHFQKEFVKFRESAEDEIKQNSTLRKHEKSAAMPYKDD